MKLIRHLSSSAVTAAAIIFASSASAATGFWEKQNPNYTIYFDGSFTQSLFYDLQTPRWGTQITNVQWEWFDFENNFDT